MHPTIAQIYHMRLFTECKSPIYKYLLYAYLKCHVIKESYTNIHTNPDRQTDMLYHRRWGVCTIFRETLYLKWPTKPWCSKISGKIILMPLLGIKVIDVHAVPIWALTAPLGCQSSTPNYVRNVTCVLSSLSRCRSGI